jgi:DNA (cytosine-5)-methyltransferase 1
VVWQVEKDPFCSDVLARHWPDAERFANVEDFGVESAVPGVGIICGGFPCQDISVADVGIERSGVLADSSQD